MGRSSTTFLAKWRGGPTTVIRVPEALADRVLEYARILDGQLSVVKDPAAVYRTATSVLLHEPVNVAAVPQRSPFRYPGGKTWLIPYARTWLKGIQSKPKILVEPFAGGSIVGLTAAFEGLADRVVLVEKDGDVASVWKVILEGDAEWLAQRIEQFNLTKANVLSVLRQSHGNRRERSFATILRNRVQRGGIMASGAGLIKSGENGRGLHSRWYPETLARRIREIASIRERLTFLEGDGFKAIEVYSKKKGTAFFVDPPYTVSARRLYSCWKVDHRQLFDVLGRVDGSVLLTYDNTPEISRLASEFGFETQAVAMKNTHHSRMSELMVGKNLTWLRDAKASAGSTPQTAQVALAFHQ